MTERMGLIHRMEDLRRLFELTTDSQARTAINAEIAKRKSLIAEIDNKAPEELPADQCGAHMAELADIFARSRRGIWTVYRSDYPPSRAQSSSASILPND